MAVTPEAARLEASREARIMQVLETLGEVFGTVTIDVMFQAIARWFGVVIFNSCQTHDDRREVLNQFAATIEDLLTKHEKGHSS